MRTFTPLFGFMMMVFAVMMLTDGPLAFLGHLFAMGHSLTGGAEVLSQMVR